MTKRTEYALVSTVVGALVGAAIAYWIHRWDFGKAMQAALEG